MNSEFGSPDAEDAKDTQRTQKEQPMENDCSHEIIGAAIEVQRVLGVGLLENTYAAALAVELGARGFAFEREVPVPATYKGTNVGIAYRADFIVERSVIIELKALDTLIDAHKAQLITYLRLSGLRLGLLINFHAFPVTKGIQRVVNRL